MTVYRGTPEFFPNRLVPWETCWIEGCDRPGSPRRCPQCGRAHDHGAIHLHPSTELALRRDWGLICGEHYRIAEREWTDARTRQHMRDQ